tara:strand:+ start:135 stop:374 length:240 start_codon:yes stop_codon:yes gene_type:complete
VSQIDKYISSFTDALGVDEAVVNENLKYNEIPEWDSIGHMSLISNLEEAFGISFETDDIVDFSSFKKGKEILKKYKIII